MEARERALMFEVRFKEMQNAQGAVEEMFEKLWAKANKERVEEELRLIREKSQARVETLEKRLDEFQKALLELVSLRDQEMVRFEAQVKERIIKHVEEAMSKLQGAQQSTAAKVAELERFWSYLLSDFKEISASAAAMKGTIANLESVIAGKLRREFADELAKAAQQWAASLAALDIKTDQKSRQLRQETVAELRDLWSQIVEPAKEAFLADLRESTEWKQMRGLAERLLALEESLETMRQNSVSGRHDWRKEIDVLRSELETMRPDLRGAHQSIGRLDEALQMILNLVERGQK